MKLKLSNPLHAADGWGVLAQVLVQQLEILLEKRGGALLKGVVRCRARQGRGKKTVIYIRGVFLDLFQFD
jgi:hypothetical protein